jgi:hypothetical protein
LLLDKTLNTKAKQCRAARWDMSGKPTRQEDIGHTPSIGPEILGKSSQGTAGKIVSSNIPAV